MNSDQVKKAYIDMIAESTAITLDHGAGSKYQYPAIHMEKDEIPRTLESLMGKQVAVTAYRNVFPPSKTKMMRIVGELSREGVDKYAARAGPIGNLAKFDVDDIDDIRMDVREEDQFTPDVMAEINLK